MTSLWYIVVHWIRSVKRKQVGSLFGWRCAGSWATYLHSGDKLQWRDIL